MEENMSLKRSILRVLVAGCLLAVPYNSYAAEQEAGLKPALDESIQVYTAGALPPLMLGQGDGVTAALLPSAGDFCTEKVTDRDPWNDVIYYPSNYNALPRLMRYSVSTNSNELWVDFSK
jgi:hypothetical protein